MRAAYLMAVQWDFLWQRPQALCEALSERHEVIAVEAPLPLMEALRQPWRFARNLARWLWGARRVGPNLLVVTPFPLRLPLGRRFEAVAALNDLLLYGSLRWLRFRLRLRPPDVVISTLPDMIRALSALEARAAVYEYLAQGKPVAATAIDETTSFDGLIRVAQTAEEFMRQVDLALAEAGGAEAEALRVRRVRYAAQHTWQARARDFEDLVNRLALP